ncbi:sialin-like isoform X4 [Varroa destructor]|uniref:Major facilitator superfamily (MFS) profile domain-containing protein n=1 Tax=Varroa destructor TaxID=109461 RepID=A0A7M7JVS3_VARDE|nr:sialin-like isoform X4 [Varroa destructor]
MSQAPGDTLRERRGSILQIRFLLCFSMFIGAFLVYAMRLNFSVAILAMTNSINATGDNITFISSDNCRPDKHIAQGGHSLSRKLREGSRAFVFLSDISGFRPQCISQCNYDSAGLLGILWTVFWFCVAADGPERHPWISAEERKYIVESRSSKFKKARPPIPWRQILFSPAVLILGLAKLAASFNYYMMLIELPTYLNDMFAIDITANGWINGGMNLCIAITLLVTARIADKLIERKAFNKTRLRKFFIVCSQLLPSFCMVLLSRIGCDYDLVMVTLFVNYLFLGFAGGGDGGMAFDIAPRFAGAVTGVLNVMANVAGLLAPKLVGYLTEDNNTLTQWHLAFLYTGIFTMINSTLFLMFGTAEEQIWAQEERSEENCDAEGNSLYGRLRKGSDIVNQNS